MALLLLASTVVPTLSASGAGAQGTGTTVVVSPKIGGQHSTFVVSFRAPDRTGRNGGVERRYFVSASGPSREGGSCVDQASANVPPTKAHQQVHVMLSPGHAHSWCRGTFDGELDELESPYCTRGAECPQFVVLVKKLGKFTFKVSLDRTPPSFAGLTRAVQCFGGPVYPGEQRPVALSWERASDRITPSSQITYDIYMASTAGGEDFTRPNWTTVGKTSFETPSLAAGRYFVVRARDQAGNEDHNRVERRAENPCV